MAALRHFFQKKNSYKFRFSIEMSLNCEKEDKAGRFTKSRTFSAVIFLFVLTLLSLLFPQIPFESLIYSGPLTTSPDNNTHPFRRTPMIITSIESE